ncbi:MAG TPA: hypothetical protein VFR47_12940 [Anaerolineales bacterium]|nr:hypothetical protein [Anaerolineales bacterium]
MLPPCAFHLGSDWDGCRVGGRGWGGRILINLLRHWPITRLVATQDLNLVEERCPCMSMLDGVTKGIFPDEKFLNEHGVEQP